MTIEHVNRKGDRYYLLSGQTKTGKPRYFFSKKLQGTPVEVMPEGFEIYESPEAAQVFLRKVKPTPITSFERELMAAAIRRHTDLEHFIVDVQGRSLVLYVADNFAHRIGQLVEEFIGPRPGRMAQIQQWAIGNAHYTKMMRFTLVDETERLYYAERWCFLGSIDNWFPLMGPISTLESLIATYGKHLGKDSFFELM